MTDTKAAPRTGGLHENLIRILGEDRVLADDWERRFYATDIFGSGITPALVIRPGSVRDLAAATRTVTAAGYSIIGRGGGTSYTGGIVPERESSVIVDTSDLLEPSQLAKFKEFSDDPDVNAAIVEIRASLNKLFDEMHAAHMQIGKHYRYAAGALPATLALVDGIKTLVDPGRLMYPKTLGLA